MAKPATLPFWATGGSAEISEPSDVKKALGWLVEKPPHQFFNWFWNEVCVWLTWFNKGYVSNVQTVTASGTTALALGTRIVYCDATLGNQILTLPDVTADDGMEVTVIKTDVSVHTVTLQSVVGGKLISGEASQVISNQYTALRVNAYSTNWYLS